MSRPTYSEFEAACSFLKRYGVSAIDIMQKSQVPDEVFKDDTAKGVISTVGRIVLPSSIAHVIVYMYDKELESLYTRHLSRQRKRVFDRNAYERDAIKVRDKYDAIEAFYVEQAKKVYDKEGTTLQPA